MKRKLEKIFAFYGWHHQLRKLKEEQKEVIRAIKWYEKVKRIEPNEEMLEVYRENVAEEIADNFNVLAQFMLDVGVTADEIKAMMKYKQARTISEMGREREGRK